MGANATSPTPANYAELFELYFDYVRGLVIKMGIRPANADDVASTILLKFIEKQFLEEFDPDAHFETPNGRRRTTFQGFLSGFVSCYVLQERDKQFTKDRKEPIRCETPVGETGTPWLEVYGPTASGIDMLTSVCLDDAIASAQRYLEDLQKNEGMRGRRDLAYVFKTVIQQVRDEGKVNRRVMEQHLGVSSTAMCLIFKDLRKALNAHGFTRDLLVSA